MTISAQQANRIATFGHAHSQTLDQNLLYMVMNDLAVVDLEKGAWGDLKLRARLTDAGTAAFAEFKDKHSRR